MMIGMVKLHDVYRLRPTFASRLDEDQILDGEVVEIHSHVALVDFGRIRECFTLHDLEQAPRGKKR